MESRALALPGRRAVVRWGKQLGGATSAGLHALLGTRAAGRVGILMYHRVAPSAPADDPPTWNVTPARLRLQLEGLLRRGVAFRPLREIVEQVKEGRPIADPTAVVTFDDGYRNVYTNAFPVLRELGIPATVFVATSCIGSEEPFPFDRWSAAHRDLPEESWRPLTWDDCREMEASGWVDIGSHTHTHGDWRGNPEAFLADLQRSLDELRRELGPREFLFAFPYGSRTQGFADDDMITAARSAGVACSLTTELEVADPAASPFGWGRLSAEQTDTPATLAAKLAGWYGWMGHGRDVLRRVAPRSPGASERTGTAGRTAG